MHAGDRDQVRDAGGIEHAPLLPAHVTSHAHCQRRQQCRGRWIRHPLVNAVGDAFPQRCQRMTRRLQALVERRLEHARLDAHAVTQQHAPTCAVSPQRDRAPRNCNASCPVSRLPAGAAPGFRCWSLARAPRACLAGAESATSASNCQPAPCRCGMETTCAATRTRSSQVTCCTSTLQCRMTGQEEPQRRKQQRSQSRSAQATVQRDRHAPGKRLHAAPRASRSPAACPAAAARSVWASRLRRSPAKVRPHHAATPVPENPALHP